MNIDFEKEVYPHKIYSKFHEKGPIIRTEGGWIAIGYDNTRYTN